MLILLFACLLACGCWTQNYNAAVHIKCDANAEQARVESVVGTADSCAVEVTVRAKQVCTSAAPRAAAALLALLALLAPLA